jgi:DNA polymerase-1
MLTVTNGKSQDWENMPLDDLAFGNAMDCDFTLRSYHILRKEMKKTKVNLVYDNLLKDILVILGLVENTGIKVDSEYLKTLDVALQKEVKRLEETIEKLSPVDDINPRSTQQMAEVLFTSDGFDLTPQEFSAKTKIPKISEAHLSKVLEDGLDKNAKEFIESLLKYKYRVKQHRTYVKGVQDALEYNEDGRIYSNYNFATVVTGRLSCSASDAGKGKRKGVSFHTLPREDEEGGDINIRNLMQSDNETKAFLAADFSQAELRVLAQCCKDENLIKAFTEGEDLHKFTASLVFGKSIEEVTKQERQIAKSVSFLIVYGGGPFKLAEQVGKSVGYCKNIFKSYQDAFPKVFSWIQQVHKFIRANGYAVSLFGRRRHLPNVNSPIKKYQYRALRQGMNFVIQSSASDLMLHSIKRLHKYNEALGLGMDILATVHDSVEVQCDLDKVEKCTETLKYVLSTTEDFKDMYNIDFVVPFEVDIEAGTSFGNLTDAEFGANGHLLNAKEIKEFITHV